MVMGANILIRSKEPRPGGSTTEALRERQTERWRVRSTPRRCRLSQPFPAFVWGAPGATTARMRRCLDRAAELSRGTTVARQIGESSGEFMKRLLIVGILIN